MKIAFIDTLGLCYDGSTLNKRGLGGSESAVIFMARELAKLGFQVQVFNDCTSDDCAPGQYDNVWYRPLKEVEITFTQYDVIIGSRSVASFAPPEMRDRFKSFIGTLPDFTTIMNNAKHKVLWMHDTFCDGDDLIENFVNTGRINEIFTLTDWHTMYVSTCDHGVKRNFDILKPHIFQTRNGICVQPDSWIDIAQKDPDLFVYNSSVTKGMIPLVTKVWPEISKRFPEAKLKVIGGYYKFRDNAKPDQQEQNWRQLVDDYSNRGLNIEFTGVITQKEISEILSKSSYMIYPSAFPETFGISTLEAIAHNVPVITCRFGALEETAIDQASYKMNYTVEKNWSCQWLNEESQIANFIELVSFAYQNKYLHQQKMYACNQVKDICTWNTVALQWKQHLYKKLGDFLPIDEYHNVQNINYNVSKTFGRRFINTEQLQIPTKAQKSIGIITAVYNAESYIANCIKSVASQNYDNYSMFIINDASTDDTANVIKTTIASLPKNIQEKFALINNVENVGAVANHLSVINALSFKDFFMILDGDDWLVNDPNIFHMYNNLYHDGAQFTYGSCWSVIDNIPLIAQPYPPEVKAKKTYRSHKFNWNMPYTHLRTFSSKLTTYLTDDDLKIDGKFPKAGGDTALFYYLIENADPDKVICVPEIVYNYNDANPINDYKVNGLEQTITANKVLTKTSPFTSGLYDLRPL